LAPDLGEAQASWALACQFSWQWQEAETAFRRALALAPSYAVARQRFALFLAWLGRTKEALLHIEEAERLDPLSLAVSASVGWIHYYARDFREARRRLEGPLEQDPTFASALSAMGSTLAELGDLEGAVDHHRRAVAGSSGSAASLSLLGNALGRAGRLDEASEVLEQLREASRSRYVSSYHLALAALGMGQEDEAMALLEHAVEERAPNVMYLGVEPIVDPLRDRGTFGGLLTSIGFPES
jgi:tetratricopeptide (TPR) repeat protein